MRLALPVLIQQTASENRKSATARRFCRTSDNNGAKYDEVCRKIGSNGESGLQKKGKQPANGAAPFSYGCPKNGTDAEMCAGHRAERCAVLRAEVVQEFM